MQDTQRKPEWLRARLSLGSSFSSIRELTEVQRLHTVCHSAQCPNLGECWSRGIATVMILGDICTRNCRFCAIGTGRPKAVDLGEPARVAEAVAAMRLRHCVITSVCRDDLPDGGASAWAATIRALRHRNPRTAIEVLTGDFRGNLTHLDIVLDAGPDIFNHNLETVERLQGPIRKTASYECSRAVLRHAKARGFVTKTGIMLGLGEKEAEIEAALRDIAADKVDIVTLGQYLRPDSRYHPVDRWVHPDEFKRWKDFGLSLGIGTIESGPLVRSSYHADEQSRKYIPDSDTSPQAPSGMPSKGTPLPASPGE